MAVDKLVDSTQLDADLTSVANAIRTKGGTSADLAFPAGFVSAVQAIPSGGGLTWDAVVDRSALTGKIDILTATQIAEYMFYYCQITNDWSIYAPNVTYMGQNTFRKCTYLSKVRLPKLSSTSTNGYCFYDCSRLAVLDLGLIGNIRANMLNNCAALTTLIIRSTSVPTLSQSANFSGTPFKSGGAGGTIYIPKSLYDHLGDGTSSDYKAASNWSTVNGYGTITWAKIEGSAYEDPEGNW